jgi:phosphopantetheine adenylyltransferase
MRTFKEYYEDGEHLRDRDRVALMPGGYKPPTKGHFKAFKYLLEDADSGIVIIGNKDRDGITADQSKKIWDVYSKYMGKPVEIELAENSPVRTVYEFADNNKEIAITVGAGAKDEDVKRYEYFTKNVEKYPLVDVVKIPMQEDSISGSQTRALMQSNLDEAIAYFVPEEISETDKDAIKNILTD